MSDDPIRDLLANVAQPYLGLPPDHVAAPFGHVEAHGGDLEAVREWVELHHGWVDNPPRPESRGLRSGRVMAPATPADYRRFVIPAAALTER